MICPKCGGKTKVTDTVNVPKKIKTIRVRQCTSCSYYFYSEEIVAEVNVEFIDDYHENNRGLVRYRRLKKERENGQ